MAQIRNAMCAKSASHTTKSALQGQSVHLLLWLFCTKGCIKTGELLRKREITSLCCITLLTLDLTVCLRGHSFDLRGRHVREMTYTGSLRWQVWLTMHFNLRQRHETAYARACGVAILQKWLLRHLTKPQGFWHNATQSYDTTMTQRCLKCIQGGSDDIQVNLVVRLTSWYTVKKRSTLKNPRKMSSRGTAHVHQVWICWKNFPIRNNVDWCWTCYVLLVKQSR